MIDSRLHTFALGGTLLVAVAAGVGIYFTNEASGGVAPVDPYANMVVIDAALAQKGPEEEKQPQKEMRAPTPPEKPVGVSHDENAKPVTAPEPTKPTKPDNVDVKAILDKNRSHDDDEDLQAGKPKIELGKIDGVEIGYGDKTYGNPYLGALKSGVMRAWEYPEILNDVGTPVGCIQLDLDGTIEKIEVKVPSGNAELDDSVERALTDFQKKNNKEPKPLPTTPDDLTYLARMELCWRMKV